MAITKVPVELSSTTGIVDNSNATAITIDSSENVTFAGTVLSDGLSVSSDTDTISTLGRAKIGAFVSDYAYFSHIDNATSTNYALNQNSTGATSVNAKAGTSLGLKINNVNKLTIDSAGEVGIGTTSPDAMLRIDQDASSVALKVTGGGSGVNIAEFTRDVGADASVQIGASAGTPRIAFVDANTFSIGVNSTYFEIADNGQLGTNTRFVIDNTGLVGIGTSSPIANLDVVRGAATGLSSINARTALLVQNNNSAGTVLSINAPNTGYSGIFLGDPQNEAQGQIKQLHTDNSMQFCTQAGATEMTLKAGKLGIGTTSPANDLQITTSGAGSPYIGFNQVSDDPYMESQRWTGTASTYYGMRVKNRGGSFVIESTDVANIGSQTFTERLRVTAAGRVGIGQTSPSHALHVVGGDNDAARVRIHNSASGQASFDLDNSEGYFRMFTDAGTWRLYDQTDGAYRMYIDTSGNVGIGTTGPTHILHVQGTSNDTIDETKGTMKVQGGGGNGMIFGTMASSPYTSYIQSAYVQDTSIAQYNLTLNPVGGNVGIGDTNPGHKLDVAGNINMSSGTLNLRDDVALDSDGTSLYIKAQSNMYFYPGNTNRGHFDSNGKLTLLNGTIQLGPTTDYREVKGVYRKNISANKSFTAAFKVEGGVLGSQFRFSIVGSIGNVVINARYEILVNHSYDCTVQSLSGSYTETKVKVVSDANEDCTVYVGANTYNGNTITSLACEVETFNGETISFDTSNPHTTAHFIHTATAGANTTFTGAMTTGVGTTTAYS